MLNNLSEVTLGVHFVSRRFPEMNINVFSRLVPAAQYSQGFCPNRSAEILLKIPNMFVCARHNLAFDALIRLITYS